MHRLTREALLASAFLVPAFSAASAQEVAVPREAPRVSGTITLDRSPEQIQVVTTRRARLGVTVNLRAVRTDTIGALIIGVTPNGPAARAGIRSGDIVTRFNGQPVTERTGPLDEPDASAPGIRLVKLAAGLSPGDSAVVQYRRDKAQRQTTIVAGDEPNSTWTLTTNGRILNGEGSLMSTMPGGQFSYQLFTDSLFFPADSVRRLPMGSLRPAMPRMLLLNSPLANLELAPLNPELGRYFGTPHGVLVIYVPEDTRLGLKPGDVVLAVGDRETRMPTQFFRVLQSYEPGEPFSFQIMRQKRRMVVTSVLTLPTEP